MSTVSHILGIGAANVDVSGHPHSSPVLRDSNMGQVHTAVGGVTHNILANLALLGAGVQQLSAVGDDLYGRAVLSDLRARGIDSQQVAVLPACHTATHLVVLDEQGDMLVAVSDLSIYRQLGPELLTAAHHDIERADWLVCDGSLPEALMAVISRQIAPQKPVLWDPVSTQNARRLRPYLNGLHTVTPNVYELTALTGLPVGDRRQLQLAAQRLLDIGVQAVVVTLGARGCYYCDRAGNSLFRHLPPAKQVHSAVGAGDAFAAGLLWGYCQKSAPTQCLDMALAAGLLATQHPDTVNPHMSLTALQALLRAPAVTSCNR